MVRGTRYVIWVTGGTKYQNGAHIRRSLEIPARGSIVVHGQAEGADTLADGIARQLGLPVIRIPYIGSLGRAGGPVRNAIIGDVVKCLAEARSWEATCLAFGGDRGTSNSIKYAKSIGLPVEEYDRG